MKRLSLCLSLAVFGLFLVIISQRQPSPTITPTAALSFLPTPAAVANRPQRAEAITNFTPKPVPAAEALNASARLDDPLAPFDRFARWASLALAGDSSASLPRGEALAWKRREALRELIATNPAKALALAAPFAWRQSLPASITRHLEAQVDGLGQFSVMMATRPTGGGCAVYREVEVGGQRYQAFVYGRRINQVSQEKLPVHGIALDGQLALSAEPLRFLDEAEAAELAKVRGQISAQTCGVCGAAAAVTVDIGGELADFCGPEHAELVNARWVLAENGGPRVGAFISASNSRWTHGAKALLYMRINFPDDLTEPISEAQAYAVMDDVNRFYVEGSYDQTWVTATVTPLVTVPQVKAWYSTAGPGALLSDAREAARRAGYDTRNYQLDIACHTSVPLFDWGGLGFVHGKGTWLQSAGVGVTAHELGHNYGLLHANWWQTTTNESVIGPGNPLEYGNNYDTMGSGGSDFSALFKNEMGWLPDPCVQTVLTNGTYRLFPFDVPERINGWPYAVKVRRDALRDYWLECRIKFASNPWLKNGILLNWSSFPQAGSGSYLLDTTPGTLTSSQSRQDAALVVGRTFSDVPADLHLTPVARGVAGTNIWMDVQVNVGTSATNQSPKLKLEIEKAAVLPGELVHFHADATDPDGDPLAFAWTFEDLNFSTNNLPWTFRTYAKAGEYVVRCVASDMKGGSASANGVVTVGTPAGFQITGRILDTDGQPVEGVRVDNGATNQSDFLGGYTDTDGRYVIVEATGDFSLTATKYGFSFTNVNWANPLSVNASLAGMDLVAIPAMRVNFSVSTNVIEEGSTNTVFVTLTRTGSTNEDLTVNLYLSGSATPGSDYQLDPALTSGTNTVIIPAGSNTVIFTLTAEDDSRVEGPETVAITMEENDAYVVARSGEALITILDNDAPAKPAVSVSTATPQVLENGADSGVFLFTRNGSLQGSLTVTYAVSGSATAGTDYPTPLGVVMIPAGSATASVAVRPMDDKEVESDETVVVTVSPDAAYTVSGGSATVTIMDDDLLTVTITPTDDRAAEPGSAGRFTVKRDGDLTANLLVNYAVSGSATAGADYEPLSGALTIPAGATSADIVVTAQDDALVEGDESVIVMLATNVAYNVGIPSSAKLFIRDDEKVAVSIEATDDTAAEPGDDAGLFTIARGSVVSGDLVVHLALSGTAVNGVDYIPLDNTVVIPDGASSVTVEVVPFDDLAFEYDETVAVTVAASTNYNVGKPTQAKVTITDDDKANVPAVGFTFTGSSAEERLSPGVSVSLSATSTAPITVEFRVLGGTAATNDYTVPAGPMTFEPGEFAKSLDLAIHDNSTPQPNRTLRLVLFNPAGATLDGNKFHTYTILDDDTAVVSVATTADSASEATGTAGSFRISRTGATNASQLVNFQITGSASPATDYAPLGTSAVIPAGAAFVDVPVVPINDATLEFSETVVLTLISAPSGRTANPTVATVTITDNDSETRPLVTITSTNQPCAYEGGANGEFTFTRTGSTANPLTLNLSIAGTAANGVDCQKLANTLTIPAGEAALVVPVLAVDDSLVEGEETVVISVTAQDTYRVAYRGTATVTIQDNDQNVRMDASDFIASEPGTDPGEFTFTRFGTTNGPLPVFFTLSGTASNGADYVAISNSFTIPAGQLSAVLPILPLDDRLVEGPETVTLTLLPNAAYGFGAATTGTVTLNDDEPMFTISATVSNVMEGSREPGVFRLTRTGDPSYDVTARLAVGGTATYGVDYPPLLTNVFFACGVTAIDLLVFPTNELVVEALETVSITILPDPAYTVLSPSNAVVTIADAGTNTAPVIAITSPTVPTVFLLGTNANILIEATVTDDDTNMPLTLLWSKTSGPDALAFGATNTANTTASFSAPGVYLLRLTADDGVLTNFTEVTVVLGAVELLSSNLLHWTLNEGSGTNVTDASGAGRNGIVVGAENWVTNGILGGTLQLSGTNDHLRAATPDGFLNGLSAFSLSLWLNSASTNLDHEFFAADDTSTNATLSLVTRTYATCGQSTNVFEATLTTTAGSARYVSLNHAVTNAWQHLVLTWTNGAAPTLFINGQPDRPLQQVVPLEGVLTNCPDFVVGKGPLGSVASWNGLVDDVRVFPRALSAGEMNALASLPPTNYGAIVYAGSNVTLQLTTLLELVGEVGDDGNPIPPGALSNTWSQVSGPLPVVIPDPSVLTNAIQFTQAGDYVFRLVADDGQVKVFDDVNVTVIEPTRVDIVSMDTEAAELGPDTAELVFTRNGDTNVELIVNLTFSGIASNGADFLAWTNLVVFPVGTDTVSSVLTPFLDHRTEGDETFIVTVVTNLAYSIGTGEATITLHDSPYGAWTVGHFTLEELTDPILSSESADLDRDGLANLVEYAFHREPKWADTNAPLVTAFETSTNDGKSYITMTYQRRLAPTDVGYLPVVSSDLQTWQSGTNFIQELSVTDDGNSITETVKSQVVAPFESLTNLFITLRVWLLTTGP